MNFGDGMFQKLLEPVLKRIHPTTIDPEGVRQSTRKELRIIDTLEPVLNQHRLVVDEAVIRSDLKTENKHYQLFYQMTRITKDKGCLRHDDRLDALAIAVGYWIDAMNKDITTSIEEHKERLLEADLRRFMEHATGSQGNQYDTLW
jgi:hypothetical protein